tara:strand:- start:4129 stop:4704 length:576 start_codon:yes stop_codon:yes gene_type:complete
MSKYVKVIKNLKYDLDTLILELDNLYPAEIYSPDQVNDLSYQSFPLAYTYHKNITNLPQHIKQAIEESINYPLMDYFFLWDWRDSTDVLEPHMDPIVKEGFNGIRARISMFVCLDGVFQLNFHDSDTKEIVESVTYSPGDIVVLNNTQAIHSGKLLSGSKRALAGYLETSEINNITDQLPFVSIEELLYVN